MGFFSSLFKRSSDPEPTKQAQVSTPVSNLAADVTLYAPVTGTLFPLE